MFNLLPLFNCRQLCDIHNQLHAETYARPSDLDLRARMKEVEHEMFSRYPDLGDGFVPQD